MSVTVTPRTAEVTIYQGDDLARLLALYEETQVGRVSPAMNDPEKIKAAEAREAYNEFVTEAAARAITVTVQQVGRRRWREARDANPPKKGDEVEEYLGFSREGVGDELMGESIIAPVFSSATERDGFLDSLSEADYERLMSAVIGVNTSVVDPKAVLLDSAVDQMSDESSRPPDRLA